MDDRLKFRVWDNVNEEYIEACNCYIENTGELYCEDGQSLSKPLNQKRFTVELCTGLKDKNKKLIYEGDIFMARVLNSFSGDKNLNKLIIGQVSYFQNECCFAFSHYQPINLSKIEIIGNIHIDQEIFE